MLVDEVLSGGFDAYELIHPILYNYRHSLELYLKFIVRPSKKTHNLKTLLEGFQKYVRKHHGIEVPQMYEEVILEFHDFDERSTTFRYATEVVSKKTGDSGEFEVKLPRLREIMDAFQESFHRIVRADRQLQVVIAFSSGGCLTCAQ